MTSKSHWTRVDSDHPCAFCGARKGCSRSAGGWVRCKKTDNAPPDYRRTTAEPTGEPEAHTFRPRTKQAANRALAGFDGRTAPATARSSKGRKPAKPTQALYYKYYSGDGKLVYEVRRIERTDGSKTCIPYHRNDEGTVVAGRPPKNRWVLYNLPALLEAHRQRYVYMVEGEKCADEAARSGCVATTILGGSSGEWLPSYSEDLRQRPVVILPDNDKPGRKFANRVAAALLGVVKSVRIVNLPGLGDGEDVVDWLAAGGTGLKLDLLARRTPKHERLLNAAEPVHVGLVVTNMADVEPVPVRWLWPDRVPLGKVTLLAGDPGLGKSWITHWMAACVSAGRAWPDCPGKKQSVGDVVLLTAEDDPADTIHARLTSAKAKLRRVHVVEAVRGEDDEHERAFSLARDLPHLEDLLVRLPETRLLVIDPVSAYLDRTDSHNNAEVRGLLAPLAALAARHEVAVVCVTHLNKNPDRSPIYRTMGSLAFVAAARAVWGVVRDKDTPARRLFVPVKNNLGRDEGHGLAFTIDDTGLLWEKDPVDPETVAAAFAQGSGDRRPTLEAAKAWLVGELYRREGRLAAVTLLDRARAVGHSKRTIERARAELLDEGVLKKTKDKAAWHWELNEERLPQAGSEVATDSTPNQEGDA